MREQVKRPTSSLRRVMVELPSLWSESSWDFTWNTIRCTACLRMKVSHLPWKTKPKQAQNKKKQCWTGQRKVYELICRIVGWICAGLCNITGYVSGVANWIISSILQSTGSAWMKLQKLLYVDKWGKKQRWWKGKSNQDKLMKQKKNRKKGK